MRRLTILVIIAGLLYSGYWFVGANAVESGARDGLTDLEAAGWGVQYTDLNTVGFPSRFDTTLTDLQIVSPDGSIYWRGPFIQVFALSYQPNRVIAALPENFETGIGGQAYTVVTTDLRMSAKVKANTDLALDALTAEMGATEVSSGLLGSFGLDRALIAFRQAPDTTQTYDFYAETNQVELPGALLRDIDPNGQLANTIGRLQISSALTFDKPLDRHAFAGNAAEPVLEKLILTDFSMTWGDISVAANGAIDVDPTGIPDGRITVKTQDWAEIIDLLVALGMIDGGIAPTITNVANTMAQGDDTLELPVTVQNGFMSVGPLPLGPAPRFH